MEWIINRRAITGCKVRKRMEERKDERRKDDVKDDGMKVGKSIDFSLLFVKEKILMLKMIYNHRISEWTENYIVV